MFSKPPGLWWWLAMSHLFLEARAQGPSQGLNCFLVPKSLLIFFFTAFQTTGGYLVQGILPDLFLCCYLAFSLVSSSPTAGKQASWIS